MPNDVPQEFDVSVSVTSIVPSLELVTPLPAQPNEAPRDPVGLLLMVKVAEVPVPELMFVSTYCEVVFEPVTENPSAFNCADPPHAVAILLASVTTTLFAPVAGDEPDGHPYK